MKKKPTQPISPAQKLREYLQAEGLVVGPVLATQSKIKHKIINFVFKVLGVQVDVVVQEIPKTNAKK